MAEGYFIQMLASEKSMVEVSSAGIGALTGYPADRTAQQIMRENGIDISAHRARQLTTQLVACADLVLVMTREHRRILVQQYGSASGRFYLLGHWQNAEIPDPYNRSPEMFREIYQQISLAWLGWKERILTC